MVGEAPPAGTPRNRLPVRARLLLGAFELLYRSRTLYWLASTIPFAGQWRVWQRLVLPRIVGRDVLEVGCGTGTLLTDLVAAGYRCRAVDASPQMVAAAQAALRRRRLEEQDVQIAQARAQALPFADGSFDTVVSTFPTSYIADPATIREIARVLRPSGRLVVVEGATLLPGAWWILPLVAFQALAYGQPIRRAFARKTSPGPGLAHGGVLTDEAPNLRSAIPLEAGGLRRLEQRDRSRIWEAYVTIGEKPPGDAPGR